MVAKYLYNSDSKGNIIDGNKVKYIIVHHTSGYTSAFSDYNKLNKRTVNKIRDFHDLAGYLVHNQRSRYCWVCPKGSKVEEWNTFTNKLFQKGQAFYEFNKSCVNFPYHYVIDRDGTITQTLPPDLQTVLGATGFNENSIHVCLAGGGTGDPRTNYMDVINQDENHKHIIQHGSSSADNTTILNDSNTSALRGLLDELTEKFKSTEGVKPIVLGHADTYILRGVPIDKACPSFNAHYWYNFPNGINKTVQEIGEMSDRERDNLFMNTMYKHLSHVSKNKFYGGIISYFNYVTNNPTKNWH